MKKLMIAAAIVCAAAFAQAAAVTWSTGSNTDGFSDYFEKTLKGQNGYTAVLSIFSDSLGETLVKDSKVTTIKPTGAMGTSISELKSGDDIVYFKPSTTYYAQLVIEDARGYTSDSGLVAFTTPGNGDVTLNFATGGGFQTSGSKLGEWQSVPEPTSGLLLLLGVAGLALRRRRA